MYLWERFGSIWENNQELMIMILFLSAMEHIFIDVSPPVWQEHNLFHVGKTGPSTVEAAS